MSDPAPKSPESLESPARPDEPRLVRLGRAVSPVAETFHDVLSEDNPTALLERIADTLAELIPYQAVHIYEADESKRELIPVLARSKWETEVMSEGFSFDEGITGWAVVHREAVLANQAHLDPRVRFVPGTPIDPEALIAVPLIARGRLKGSLNIYRVGDLAEFSDEEFHLATASVTLPRSRWTTHTCAHASSTRPRPTRSRASTTTAPSTIACGRRSCASAEHDTVALVMLDLDDFKKVNDVFGHGVGDQLLMRVADALRSSVRSEDVVSRVGGEEFAIILPSGDLRSALALAARFAETLGKLEVEAAGRLTVRRESQSDPNMRPTQESSLPAEAAMMTAKMRGKGLVLPYDEIGGRASLGRERAQGRHPLDRTLEDAAEPLGEALEAERRRPYRAHRRGRATTPDRLPQLPRLPPQRRRSADRIPGRPDGRGARGLGRAPADACRTRRHGPRRGDGRAAPHPRRGEQRVCGADRGHGGHRRVAPGGATRLARV